MSTEQARRERRHERALARREPVPPHIFFAKLHDRVASLWVRGPGALAVQTKCGGDWQPYRVTRIQRRIRPYRLDVYVTDPTGRRPESRLKMSVYAAGNKGRLDVGEYDRSGDSGLGGFGDDPISMIVGLILLVVFVILLPVGIRSRWSRRGAARRLRRQLFPAR